MTLESLAACLQRSPRSPVRAPGRRDAAVAVILRHEGGRPEVLLMERAIRRGDRWSGQVSFPGGRWTPGDADLLATAVRETREEVGLDLVAAQVLGALEPVRAIARGKVLPLAITPFVFSPGGDQTPSPGAEATACFWLPLDAAARGDLDGEHEYRLGPLAMKFPCWRFDDHVVWGLTYQMLGRLLALATRA